MRSSRQLNRSVAALPLAVAAALIVSLAGCASPGPARPPSLQLPRTVTDLDAMREGGQVTLRWTTPEKTTDGLLAKPPLMAEICQQLASSPCATVKSVAVRPGAAEEAQIALPQNMIAGPAALLIYRVQILNNKGRSAGPSDPAFSVAGAAPPAVAFLHGTPNREGATLEWKPQHTNAAVELDRVLLSAPQKRKPSAKQPLQLAPTAPTKVRLQAGKDQTDSGGTFDPTAQRGQTYRYTAQRVRTVMLDGHKLQLRSAPSDAITVVMRDTFPPKTPTGLAAVPGDNAIDLSWDPNTEPDLAGYLVYRQAVSAAGADIGPRTRLTPAPIPAPAFSDRTARPGESYAYRVVAVDSTGNQSPASAEVQESPRK